MSIIEVDPFAWWRNAVATLPAPPPPITEGKPECGYFKLRTVKDGPFEPVAIFPHEGQIVALRGFSPAKQVTLKSVWPWVARTPIPYEVYQEACTSGRFPDDLPPVTAPAPAAPEAAPPDDGDGASPVAAGAEPVGSPEPRGIGDNKPPMTIYDRIKAEIEDRVGQALTWLKATKIETETQAQLAQNWRDELAALSKKANAERETEKRPHLDACAEIEARWKPLRDGPADVAKQFGAALKPYLQKLEVERQQAAQTQIKFGVPVEDVSVPPAKVKGAKRTVALKTVTTCVVVNHAQALAFFADSPEVIELVQKLAARAHRAGITVPGTEIRKEQVAS